MECCSIFYFALSLSLLNNLIILSSSAPNLNLTSDEQALLAFKSAVIDDDGILSNNWSTRLSACHWIGVSCGKKHRTRVTALNLSGFHLRGTLSPHLANLSFLRSLDVSDNGFMGFIPSWFGALPRIRHLHLNNNTFSGRIPPALLFNISTLQTLDIGYNNLVGKLPKEMANLSSSQLVIEIVNLEGNQITGSIPNGMLSMSSLIEINMRDNSLSGELPKDDMCGPKLKRIILLLNQLSGEIPKSISKCKGLEALRLRNNNFHGNIPTEIGSLAMLKILSLATNNFNGNIPVEIGSLAMLTILSLWSNNLTGVIPKQIGNLTVLNTLDLSFNNLKGELPTELGHLAFLENMNVVNNSLSGLIPSSIFNMSNLKILDLSLNKFSGSLPSNMGLSLFNLEELLLSGTNISGEIPSSISNASMLTRLEMSNNSLGGPIPNFGSLRYLTKLFVWGNNLTGADSPTQELEFLSSLTNCLYLESLEIGNNPLNGILPTSIGNFSTSLINFLAYDCSIHGVIPPTIGNLSNLLFFNLKGNRLTGLVPEMIGNMKRLQALTLSGNQLQGHIPNQLCQLSNLGDLYMDNNSLTGSIPECLGDLLASSLRFLDLSYNKLNSVIPASFWNLIYLVELSLYSNHLSGQLSPQITHLKEIIHIYLDSNQFSGDIPGSIDGCETLESLDLSNNMFMGSIPQSLGKVRGLAVLDLSWNNISGSIPESLEDLPILQYFDVSHNKLEGKIPDGGCFANLTTGQFYFDNNSALCGASRFQVPPCPGPISTSVARLIKYIIPIFIVAIILVIIVAMLIRRRKREVMPTPNNVSLDITEWRRVSYIELSRGTSSFSETNLLGRGSFGSVFKGTLADGLNVAVKVFNLQLERAAETFASESAILSTIRHRNLVQVIGCCTNTEFKALILEYMANGSLYKWLYLDNYSLNLLQRLKIALDVASALEYLHHRHTYHVVHCDIKPNNVLLDEDMTARICDFGMSKLFDDGEAVVQTTTLATIGYAAPEYGSEGKVSTNGDVYSYGIMLLEMFTGKKPMDDMFGEEMSIKEWVSRAIQENAVSQVVDPTFLSREDDDDEHLDEKMRCVSYIFDLAMKCLAFSAKERINMMQVVGALHKIKDLLSTNRVHRQ